MRFQATHKLVTYLLVLSSFAALASSEVLPAATAVAFLAAWALSFFVDPGGRAAAALDRAATPLRVALVAAIGWAGFAIWRRLPEPDLVPALDVVLLLLAYKLFHRRGNRDYLHVYVLAFVVVLASSALAATFLFAAAFGVYVVLATWTLILFHLRREMEENYLVKHSAQAPSQKVGVDRILNSRRVVGVSFFAATGLVAMGVIAGAVLTFAIVPRVGSGFVFGAARPPRNMIGFSDEVSLGSYGLVSADNRTIALRVRIARIARLDRLMDEAARDHAIDRLYWRGTVYDRYDRGRWTRSHEPALRTILDVDGVRALVREPAFEAGAAPSEPAASSRPEFWSALDRQDIDVVGLSAPVAFALDRPFALEQAADLSDVRFVPRFSGEVALRLDPRGGGGGAGATTAPIAGDPHRDLGIGLLTPNRARYFAYSSDRPWLAATRRVADLPGAVRAAYLELPGSLSPRVQALVSRVLAGQTTAAARVGALVDWLRSTHAYTLRLPARPAGIDPVEDFLLDHTSGHCEYFASALVVLLRTAGIPARYVNGYLGGEWNGVGKYIAVRDNRAHSWAEAYVDGLGWSRLDATPPAPAPRRAGGLRQLLESADFYWARWVIGYDLDRQVALLRRLGRDLGLGAAGTQSGGWRFPSWALVLAAVTVLAAVASRRWSRARRLPKPARVAPAGGGAAVQRLYRRALERLARAGLPRRLAETPREFATRVTAAQAGGGDLFEQLTELYTAARFGGRPVDADVLRDIGRRLGRLGVPSDPPPVFG